MGNEIIEHTNLLKDKTTCFTTCVWLLNKEESETNQAEIIGAWKLIIRKLLNEIHSLLISLKEEIAWSLLDERKSVFLQVGLELKPALDHYNDHEDENTRKQIIETSLLLDEGKNGFRQSYLNDTYFEILFKTELQRYREDNEERIKLIYKQDCQDEAEKYTDDKQLRKAMLDTCRQQLFGTRFGKIFHDQGRKIKPLAFHITEQKEQDYKDINEFFDKYIAYEIAEKYCKSKQQEAVYQNIIFKDNVDVDKVMRKLKEFINNQTIGAQIHWYVVYKVFDTKKWLKKATQKAFVEQMNSAFYSVLKCSTADFKEVDSYFKNKDYKEWTLGDNDAPQRCERYKTIADKLDEEFQDEKYAKQGMVINTRKLEKFR